MALTAVAAIPPESPSRDPEPYRPAGVFISYASEDHDIAQAIYQSLQALGETIFDRVKIFLDSKSIDGGDEIRADIREGLKKSDFLLVLYTGLFKRSHGYTGWEVGFFDGLIEDEIAKYGIAGRKIVYLYSGEPPAIGNGVLGISMNVDIADLGGSRTDYIQKSIQSPDNPDALARALLGIADRAESRLPPPLQEHDNLDRKRNRRRKAVAEEINPALKGKLFDSMSTRIARHSVEQKFIELELPKPAADQIYVSIPDDAKLTPNSGAFEIFGISQLNDALTWREFSNELKSRAGLCGVRIARYRTGRNQRNFTGCLAGQRSGHQITRQSGIPRRHYPTNGLLQRTKGGVSLLRAAVAEQHVGQERYSDHPRLHQRGGQIQIYFHRAR
jgi:hypothetical protein